MKDQGISVPLMVAALPVLLAAAVASADDTKIPGAIAASTSSSKTSGVPANAKPAAVQASTGKTLGKLGEFGIATHLEVLDFSVKLVGAKDDSGIYRRAQNLADVRVTVKGRGIETEIAGLPQKGPNDPANYDGLTAFQILVEQGYFEHKNGVGFILTKKGEQKLGIRDDSGKDDSGGKIGSNKRGFLGTTDGPDLVAPPKPESVVEDRSQKGGLFGYTVDGDWETYNPDDPNTPEGKRKILRERLSVLSRECNNTPESRERSSCWEGCSNLMFSEYGKISLDPVEKCRRECDAIFEQKMPQVCRESEAVQAQLEQLGDE